MPAWMQYEGGMGCRQAASSLGWRSGHCSPSRAERPRAGASAAWQPALGRARPSCSHPGAERLPLDALPSQCPVRPGNEGKVSHTSLGSPYFPSNECLLCSPAAQVTHVLRLSDQRHSCLLSQLWMSLLRLPMQSTCQIGAPMLRLHGISWPVPSSESRAPMKESMYGCARILWQSQGLVKTATNASCKITGHAGLPTSYAGPGPQLSQGS